MSVNPKKRFQNSRLPETSVTEREFNNTITLCSTFLKDYRGRIQQFDKLAYGLIFFGFILIIVIGISTSSSESGNWGSMILWILIYFIFVPIVYKVSKCFQNKFLRQAHFVLSVVCRSENNRYYLQRGVEVRPGYLARWIEFAVIDKEIKNRGAAAII